MSADRGTRTLACLRDSRGNLECLRTLDFWSNKFILQSSALPSLAMSALLINNNIKKNIFFKNI